ncbi:MAG: polyprenyl synthetase family protein [Polyangiaceae bacterium]
MGTAAPAHPTREGALDASRVAARTSGADRPRAAVAQLVVRTVARGFGTRQWTFAVKLGARGVETYDEWVYGELGKSTRDAWLKRDLSSALRTFHKVLRRDEALLRRIVARLASGPEDIADDVIPESIVFLRMAVAAGALGGAATDETHAELDRWATATGLVWEALYGVPDERALRGGLRMLGLPTDLSRPDVVAVARETAVSALRNLPDGAPAEALARLLDGKAIDAATLRARRFTSCEPTALPPVPRKGVASMRAFLETLPPNDATRAVLGILPAIDAALHAFAPSESKALSSATEYLAAQGGKRVRALLTALAAYACDADPTRTIRPGVLVEWLHQTSLIVDDVVDEAPLRRGVPSLHHATSQPFAGLVTSALLRALLVAAGRAGGGTARALRLRDRAPRRTRMDRDTQGTPRPRTAYLRIIATKTARLFSCAATLGALSASASKAHVKALGEYGRQVGIAFQIVDDLLDYVGTEADLGKQPGADHGARKVTLPLLLIAQAGKAAPAVLFDLPFESVRDIVLAAPVGGHASVRDACLALAKKHVDQAKAALRKLPRREGVEALGAFADSLVERRR